MRRYPKSRVPARRPSPSRSRWVRASVSSGEVSWQNWHFRFRIDQRVGTVVNLVKFDDGGRLRSVMYEGSLSELYVPYMDPSNGWNDRVFIDAGEFYAGPGFL